MYGEWSGRKEPIADKEARAFGLSKRWQWPIEASEMHNTSCTTCGEKKGGKMRITWSGEYIGSDWTLQRRISYRCNKCHKVVTFVQRVYDDRSDPIETQVLYP